MTDSEQSGFPVRVGVQIQPQHAEYADLRRAVAQAEELGADVIFTWDHFFPLYGDPDGKHFECWTLLAAMAEATARVEIGALVTCNSYRNPHLLADMARTVDHISDGRLILGIGSGWFERDYEEYGYEFGRAGTRLDALDRDLPLIRSRWAQLNPPPTRPIPVLIGGGGEKKTLRIVAEHADVWHTFGDAETITHKGGVLRDWCAKVGRDPAEIEWSAGVSARPGRLPEDVDDYASSAEELRRAGVTLLTYGVGGPDHDLGPLRELLDWRDDVRRQSPDAAVPQG
ncbi:LLM class F420-dependent oxidoreductase [Janibacter sp. G56]|uniref:LLM class F420-dependent oxidoreductase n=1 Tax=Janibacter sp. G56 TaxID=3418717 RepID=UPI003CFEE643